SLADSLGTLALARVVQGLGAAGIMSVNAALVRLTYPSAQLGRGMAINSMVVATSSVAGPSVAAAILSVASWPWLFALNLPLGLLTLALGLRALPANSASGTAPRALSWIDMLLNALMFSLLVLAADLLGARHGAGGGVAEGTVVFPLTLRLAVLAAGLAVAAIYVHRQLRRPTPLLPVDLLRIPVFALSICTSIAAFSAQMLAFIALPYLLLVHMHRSAGETGLLITAWPLAIVVVAPIAGRLIGRYPAGLLGGIGLTLLAIGLAMLAHLPSQPTDAAIVWRLALCGAGFGLFQPPNNHTIVTAAPLHRSGGAGGMQSSARLVGQTLGAALLAAIFNAHDADDASGSLFALGVAAGLAGIAGLFSSLRLRGGRTTS
ncbi:MAG: MFS transporter, partial [Variovorax sp.]